MANNSTKKNATKRSTGSRSGNTSRNNTSSGSRRTTPAARRKQEEEKVRMRSTVKQELIIWGSLAICILLFIANLGVGGIVGDAVSWFLFALFGMLQYILPLMIVPIVIFMISNRFNAVAKRKLILGIPVLVLLCTLVQLIVNSVGKVSYEDFKIGDSFANHKFPEKNILSGGFFGELICKPFVTWFDQVASYIIVIALLLVLVLLITEVALSKKIRQQIREFKDGSEERRERQALKRAQHAQEIREHNDRQDALEEERDREYAERAKARSEKKVKGVAFDTEIRENEPDFEDVHEVHSQADLGRHKNKTEEEKAAAFEAGQPQQNFWEADEKPESDYEDIIEKPVRNSFFHHEKVTTTEAAKKTDSQLERYMEEQSGEVLEEVYEEDFPPVDTTPRRKEKDYLKPGNVIGKDDFDEAEAANEWEEDVTPAQPVYTESDYSMQKSSATQKNPAPEKVPAVSQPVTEEFVPAKPAVKKQKKYMYPPKNLLSRSTGSEASSDSDDTKETAKKLQTVLATFGVRANVVGFSRGPAVTRYELQPELGVKVSKIVSLADDIKLGLAATDIRIEAPIPGKSLIGIEVPNSENTGVKLGDLIIGPKFSNAPSKLTFIAGKDIAGQPVIGDIAKMPHLLIAGSTGSGKSVCINTIVMSLLYHADPNEVKLIMVDPKVVELSVYNGIPHLLCPVVTDPKKACGVLNWAVAEMTDRYNKFAQCDCRNISNYNEKIDALTDIPEEEKPEKMPQIVVIIDELADLMMVASKEVEGHIVRLAQLARAAGIHLIIATQRPSVDVITGLIKANVPSRIAFAVSSAVDSRTIIDMGGAEKLLGKGDMLYYPQGVPKPMRVQGAFVSDKEVNDVVEYIKTHNQADTTESTQRIENHIAMPTTQDSPNAGTTDNRDAFFADAGRAIIEKQRASIGMLQRLFSIGFNRAARIMDQLGEAGVVGPEEGTKPRKILMTMEEFEGFLKS